MPFDWRLLSQSERHVVQTTAVFLSGRLQERPTIDWALALKADAAAERYAVNDLLDRDDGRRLSEPWRSAWRLIEQQWSEEERSNQSNLTKLRIRKRIEENERSSSLINAIVDLVRPRIEVKSRSADYPRAKTFRMRPKTVSDLVSASLTSGPLLRPYEICLASIKEGNFLLELAQALDGALNQGLAAARQIGWDGRRFWRIGDLRRVYFREKDLKSEPDQVSDRDDPDDFNDGIAPSTKLLHAVVLRLGSVAPRSASLLASQWLATASAVHIRLWAALARERTIVAAEHLSDYLARRSQMEFWDIRSFPEISELRSLRFTDLDSQAQARLLTRLRRGPPRQLWGRHRNASEIEEWREYWSVREMRRIEVAGGDLTSRTRSWYLERLKKFPDLQRMSQVEADFPSGVRVRALQANPDNQYDELEGEERLEVLEKVLAEAESAGEEGPGQRAADWLRLPSRAANLLPDLVATTIAGKSYPKIWGRFGWAHRPAQTSAEPALQQQVEAEAVLKALLSIDAFTAEQAIESITNWLFDWAHVIAPMKETALVFLKLWPIAANATEKGGDRLIYRRDPADPESNEEAIELNTLNSPIGLMMQVFNLTFDSVSKEQRKPFDDPSIAQMRDAVTSTSGRAGLVAKYRLLEFIGYFTLKVPDWTTTYLAPLLLQDNEESLTLWLAVAKSRLPPPTLSLIGPALCRRALDSRLSRDARSAYVTALVVNCFHSLLQGASPVVGYAEVQQVLRMLDDEVRASAAGDIKQLVLAATGGADPQLPEVVFRSAVRPFFERVWPQEKSLTTPGASRNLADLPATCGAAFPECVSLVVTFLVPFDCWSLHDVGIDDRDGAFSLERIDSISMASSLLDLLNAVIGTADRAVVPHDLDKALMRIEAVAPKLTTTGKFRRLKLLSR